MSTIFNESASIREESYTSWRFRLRNESGVRLTVISSPSWVGLNVYVMADNEFNNFSQNKLFDYFTNLSCENTIDFRGTEVLPDGKYYIVIQNRNRFYDGQENIARVSMRLDLLM